MEFEDTREPDIKKPLIIAAMQDMGNLFYSEFKDSVTAKAIAETVDNIENFIKK